MLSHQYEIKPGRLVRALAATVFSLAGWVVLVRVGLWLNVFPSPRPALNGDQFMMLQRDLFARGDDTAGVLIIGDSSALMGVDARRLGDQLPGRPRVYNLGLFLGLPLDVYGEVAGDFIARHPGQVRRVLLLTTVSRLTDARPVQVSMDDWSALRTGSGLRAAPSASAIAYMVAMEEVRTRLLSRVVPFVTHQRAGVFQGNLLTAERRLEAMNGSLFLEGHRQPTGRETLDWELDALALEQAARLRSMIPAGVELMFGVMPVPETLAGPEADQERSELLDEFNQALRADRVLTELPLTMPDGFFADRVHLRRAGQIWFTDRLARLLSGPDRAERRGATTDHTK